MTPAAETVSLVIPSYNRAALLPRAIDSILAQREAPAFEVLVIDDGSTDDTAAVVERRYREPAEVRIVSLAHGGLSAARNAGFEHAGGEWLCFFDSDDQMYSGTLAVLNACVQDHPELEFVGFECDEYHLEKDATIDHYLSRFSPGWRSPALDRARFSYARLPAPDAAPARVMIGDFFPAITGGDLFFPSGLFMRRAALAVAGPYNPRYWCMNDYDVHLRLCAIGPGGFVEQAGFLRETGRGGQISGRRTDLDTAIMHLRALRNAAARALVPAHHRATFERAHGDALYWLGCCLIAAGRRRCGRRFLRAAIGRGHKVAKGLVRTLSSYAGDRR